MDDPNELAKDIITGAISDTAEKVLDSKVALNLLGPVTTELGGLMGEIASAARFYATDNLARIFKRWAEDRKGKQVTGDEFKRILPLLPTASLVSDEDLQERWARLLEATANPNSDVLPSFGHTLAQMTAKEARFLNALWKYLYKDGISRAELWKHYSHVIRRAEPAINEAWGVKFPKLWEEFQLVCSDLQRLGVIKVFDDQMRHEVSIEVGAGEILKLTRYGALFVEAVMDVS